MVVAIIPVAMKDSMIDAFRPTPFKNRRLDSPHFRIVPLATHGPAAGRQRWADFVHPLLIRVAEQIDDNAIGARVTGSTSYYDLNRKSRTFFKEGRRTQRGVSHRYEMRTVNATVMTL